MIYAIIKYLSSGCLRQKTKGDIDKMIRYLDQQSKI